VWATSPPPSAGAGATSTRASTPAGARAVLGVVTDQPDALYERARAAGARVVRELHDEDYGSREFTARDPEGVYWSFGTYPGH
jgi:uncharacterized glyoxalase superfamily protein PhnB